MSTSLSNFRIIDTPDYDLIQSICNPDFYYMGIDVETYSSDPNDAKGALDCTLAVIRLISIMTETWDCPVVVDVRLINDRAYVLKLLQAIKEGHESNFILIAHSASYEYTIFYHNYGIRFTNIKDTVTAAATLDVATGWKEGTNRGKKLHEIAWHYFGINLDKTLQVSDWNANLSRAQYEYSALDVGAPDNVINVFTENTMKSVVIEFYMLMEKVCREELNMKDAFELDQACVPITADMEANGIPLNIELCNIASGTLNNIKESCLQKLCTGLGRRLQLDLITGELIVPDDLKKLLNNNSKLLRLVNSKLPKHQVLNDVQMSSLESLLKQLDKGDDEEEDADDELNIELAEELEELWHTRELVRDLLEYKKHFKVCGEVGKYLNAVRGKTNCIHGPIRVIGTGTARTSSGGGSNSINLQSIPSSYINTELSMSDLVGGPKSSKKYKFNISVRTLFGIPYDSGKVWVSCDYASQELRIAGAASGDQSIMDVFRLERDNPNLIHPITNEQYPNPLCDLHIVAARKMFPHLEEIPLWELSEASKKPLPDGKVPRKVGKIVNFCVGMDAEVLTKKGWRKYGEFDLNDEILTYDVEKEHYVWDKPIAINKFSDVPTIKIDYKGDHNVASEESTSRWSVITTPDHRWWSFTSLSAKEKLKGINSYQFRTTEEIQKEYKKIKIFICSSLPNLGTDCIEHWDDLMVISSVMNHIDLDKPDSYEGKYVYLEECNNLNNNLGKHWVRDYKGCDKDDIKPMNPYLMSRLNEAVKKPYKRYGHVLFDKDVVDGVFNKYGLSVYDVNTWYEFIHKLDKVTLQAMFDIFQDINGVYAKRTITMSFNNKDVKDLVQIIGVLLGYSITDFDYSGVHSFIYKSTTTISSYKCEGMYFSNAEDQDVWCPTTHTGTWVMRYNNFIGITGNSILYGKSDKGFSTDFGLSIEATRLLLKAYSSGFPRLYKWIDETSARAKYEKVVKSAYGRTVFAFEGNAKGDDSENAGIRKAVNAIIQTSAGDMIKLAMKYIKDDVELWKLLTICSVVHDR